MMTSQKTLDNPTETGYPIRVLAKSKTRCGSRNIQRCASTPISHGAFFMSCESPGGLRAGAERLTGFLWAGFQPRVSPPSLFGSTEGGSLFNPFTKGDLS